MLYYRPTPNGHKITMFLEKTGIDYRLVPVDIGKGSYVEETNRLYGVLERHLAKSPYVADADYSIADIAIYPWIVPWEMQQQNLEDFRALKRWFEAIASRPSSLRAYAQKDEFSRTPWLVMRVARDSLDIPRSHCYPTHEE